MNTNGKRRVALVAVAVAVVFLFAASEVSAWGPVNRHHSGQGSVFNVQDWFRSRGYSSNSSRGAVSTRQSSTAPKRIQVGDQVVVVANETKIMSGRNVLGLAEKGQTFVVKRIEGPWLRAEIEVGEKMIKGWILNRNVADGSDLNVGASAKADAVDESKDDNHRSYSAQRSYRTNRRYRR